MTNRFVYIHDSGYYDPKIVEVHGSFQVNSAQTTDTNNYKCQAVQGNGVKYVSNVATGVYKLSLEGNYNKFLGIDFMSSGLYGTQVAIASLSSSTPYVIKTMGTSAQADWITAGLDSSVTAQVGVAFVAGAGASGATGTGYAVPIVTAAGNDKFQIFGDPNTTINVNKTAGAYPYLMFQTLSPTNSSTTTMIATAPSDLTVIKFRVRVRNSSIMALGETLP